MKKSWRNNVEFYLIGLLVLTVAAFSITMPEIFWSISNFQSVASQMPVLGILALAMAVTMLCGGINLSIIATANACFTGDGVGGDSVSTRYCYGCRYAAGGRWRGGDNRFM